MDAQAVERFQSMVHDGRPAIDDDRGTTYFAVPDAEWRTVFDLWVRICKSEFAAVGEACYPTPAGHSMFHRARAAEAKEIRA